MYTRLRPPRLFEVCSRLCIRFLRLLNTVPPHPTLPFCDSLPPRLLQAHVLPIPWLGREPPALGLLVSWPFALAPHPHASGAVTASARLLACCFTIVLQRCSLVASLCWGHR